ncbi:MAG: HIT domain-containing protein [Candidatus Levybacteria bacterium]|nr:HIT domain-containing protein [Candidatus Levybacteria bacterium]
MNDCIFCKIANKEIPKEFVYEDEEIMVFSDIHPVKPIHLLIVPKKHLVDFTDVTEPLLFQKAGTIIQKLAKEQKLLGKGYRIVVNGGGAQIIDHLHFHLMGPVGIKI